MSDRELDVFGLIAHGFSNPEIAQELYISETKTHITHILHSSPRYLNGKPPRHATWKTSPAFREGFYASKALCDEFVGGDHDEVVVVMPAAKPS